MEDSSSAIPDWADLPPPVVHLISQKVKCITDYVRFRFVCSSWRAGSLAKPRHLPLQLPWLMIPYSISARTDYVRSIYDIRTKKYRQVPIMNDDDPDDGMRLFYDLWKDKIRKIPLPATIGKACCATYRGWLLLVAPGGSELFLLNPITRARVDLPPFNIPVKHIGNGVHDVDEPMRFDDRLTPPIRSFRSQCTVYSITKLTFSMDPTDPNCIIMVFMKDTNGVFFCKVGEPCWTYLVASQSIRCIPRTVKDAVYSNRKFYLYYYGGEMEIYDLDQQVVQGIYISELELAYLPTYFVVGKSGVYMVVVHHKEEAEVITKPPKPKIDLYQVIGEELGMQVKRVVDTSDTALFYASDNSHYLAVCTNDWASLSPGSIYMEYVYRLSVGNEVEPCYGIFLAKIDDGNPELSLVGVSKMATQFWPHPSSMWFQPNFH